MEDQEQNPKGESKGSMPFLAHINELRGRLLNGLVALAITTAISFIIGEWLIDVLLQPIGGMKNVQSIEITENVGVFMRVTLLSGFIFAFPYILYQLLAFILPGLTKNEKKWVIMAIPFATLLFLMGVAFAYFIMLPAAVPYLVSFLGITTLPRLSNYINFITSIMFWIGISFEMPLFVYILARFNIITGRLLASQWRVAIVIIAILASLITPTVDPVNMAILMLPLVFLYFLSVIMALFAVKKNPM